MAEQYTPPMVDIRKIYAYSQAGDRIHRTDQYLEAFDRALAAHDAQVLRDAGVTFEHGNAIREADGTVWDHEGGWEEQIPDEKHAKWNAEHRAEMGDQYDGSIVVRVRRVREGDWQVIEADRIAGGTSA